MNNRVAVTGVGLVTPLGIGNDENWDALYEGKSGIGKVTRFDDDRVRSQIAGEVRDFDPLVWMDKKEVKKTDLFIQYAIGATEYALEDSGFEITEENAQRVGVLIGSGIGGLPQIEQQHNVYLDSGPRRITPFFIPSIIINMASGQVSIRHGARGPNSATSTACATSSHAIGDAYEIIARGDADAMICGGAEGVITPLAFAGFCSMRALSKRNDEPELASRPFDSDRDGFVMAEGSGILILEKMEKALERDADIYAEIAGYGMSGDAYHISAPHQEGKGAKECMKKALEDANIEPGDIDYINAHGTSTPTGDVVEVQAIKQVFGDHAYELSVSSTKSITGHLLGAAGGVETSFTAKALNDGKIPPTMNLDEPDEECDLDFVPHRAKEKDMRYALTNSFGFGGTNSCLILKKYE